MLLSPLPTSARAPLRCVQSLEATARPKAEAPARCHQHQAGQWSHPVLSPLLCVRRKHFWCHAGSPCLSFSLALRNQGFLPLGFPFRFLVLTFLLVSHLPWPPFLALLFPASFPAVPGIGHISGGDLPSIPVLSQGRRLQAELPICPHSASSLPWQIIIWFISFPKAFMPTSKPLVDTKSCPPDPF